MRDTISRQDAIDAYYRRRFGGSDEVIAAMNALPAMECKQCDELVQQINGLNDAMAQAEGIIADLRARDQTC